MKKTLLILAALAAGASLRADTATKGYSVTTDFTYASEYVFRGVQNAHDSFQPSVEVSSNGFGLGVWTNAPITKHENNEVDFYGNYSYKMSDALSLEAVTTYYWYPEAATGGTRHSVESGVGATYNFEGFSPSVYAYYDFILQAQTVQASIGYSIPLKDLATSIDLSAYAGNVSANDFAPDARGAKVKQSYEYYGGDLSLPYQLSTTAKLTAAVHYATNQNLPAGTLKDRVWYTLGATVGF